MNGPEHYRAAEDLAHDANLILQQSTPHTAEAANAGASALAALAQVHATLALAAATAGGTLGQHGVPSSEWAEASQ